MEVAPAMSVTSDDTDVLTQGLHLASTVWTHYPEKNKTSNTDHKSNIQEGLGDLLGIKQTQKGEKEFESLIYSKYRIGGSVESVFSQGSVQHPEWTLLRPSKSQDALTLSSCVIHHQGRLVNKPDLVGIPDVVDDVVGDEVISKSPWQQLQKDKIIDLWPKQTIVAQSSSLTSSHNSRITANIYRSESILEHNTQSEEAQTLGSHTQIPIVHETEQECNSFDVKKNKEMSGTESEYQWTKNTESTNSSSGDETDSNLFQAAESDASQDILVSLLKSILMEREEKIHYLSQELRRTQSENGCLQEENKALRKEFEIITFAKERKKQDLFDLLDPSSSLVLQQQIVTLKNQIHDLQEANESAVLELANADEEISQQKKEISMLRSEYNQKLEDSREEIRLLKEKISCMPNRLNHSENYEQGLHKEISQLRIECRRLRSHSHQLNEENFRLKEELWGINRQHEHLLKRTSPQMRDVITGSHWNDHLKNDLQSKRWHSVDTSLSIFTLYRNNAFKEDGTFSKCKSGFGSVNMKEPWENIIGILSEKYEERVKSNASPMSLDSENTDVLIMGYHEEIPPNTPVTDMHGGVNDDMQEQSANDFCSSSQNKSDIFWSSPNQHPVSAPISVSPNKAVTNTRSQVSVLPRRPFAPKNIVDLKVGDLVKFSRPEGKISKGTIRYIGHLHGRKEMYLGVELEGTEVGKHDGTFQGTCYFLCKPNKGVFVNFSKIIMAWG
ncbi:uncharacterized protein WCC33_001028 [Rhinophrynus dorsalis]